MKYYFRVTFATIDIEYKEFIKYLCEKKFYSQFEHIGDSGFSLVSVYIKSRKKLNYKLLEGEEPIDKKTYIESFDVDNCIIDKRKRWCINKFEIDKINLPKELKIIKKDLMDGDVKFVEIMKEEDGKFSIIVKEKIY